MEAKIVSLVIILSLISFVIGVLGLKVAIIDWLIPDIRLIIVARFWACCRWMELYERDNVFDSQILRFYFVADCRDNSIL